MSNRNFDSRVIISRLQNRVIAQNLYDYQANGVGIVNNPQTSESSASRITSYDLGVETTYERGLIGGIDSYSISLGGIANFVTPTASIPSAPTGLSVTAGDSSADISFTAGSSNGSPIINYEYSLDGGAFISFSPTQTTSPVTISGLTNGTTYTIRLKAVNRIGASTASSSVSVTPAGLPSAPTSLSATPGNGQLSISFTLASDGGSDITNYEYADADVIGELTYIPFDPSQNESPVVIGGLTNGTTYYFKLRAVNSVGAGPGSSVVLGTPSTTPAAPILTSITAGNTTLDINFTAGSNGGSDISNYKYALNTGMGWSLFIAFSPADTTSPVRITGLTNGTSYQVKLVAVNANGDGAESNVLSGTPVGGYPSQPTALSGVGGNQTIYLLFTTPASNGGSAITNYKYSTDNGLTFIALSTPQTWSPIEINYLSSDGTTPLTNGVSYNIILKAVNANGDGASSDMISVTPNTNTLLSSSRLINLDATNAASYSGSGTAWTNLDSAGSYSATLQNGPTFNSSDPSNKYFTFDGTNQIAEIAAAAAINPSTSASFTLQIWARVNTASPNFVTGDGLISKQFWSPSFDGYSLSLRTDKSLYLKMNGSSVDGTYSSGVNVWDNNWALYTIVVDFGGGSGSPSYTYVSTRRVVTGNNTDGGIPSANAPLQFPRGIQDTTFNFCPADVGAFYVYNTILSQTQIIQNYDATKSRYGL